MFIGFFLLLGMSSIISHPGAGSKPLGNFVRLERTPQAIVVQCDLGQAQLSIFNPGIFHLTLEPKNPRWQAIESFAVIEKPEEVQKHNPSISGDRIRFSLPDGTVEYDAKSGSLVLKSESGTDILTMEQCDFSDSQCTVAFNIHGARDFFGLGEKTLPFNKYGSKCTMWNTDFPAYPVRFDPLYETIPFLIKAGPSGAYGLFFDNASRTTFDVGASDSNKLVYTAKYGALQLYLMTGKNAAEVVRKFADLTGKMHMPPLWVLGYQQSHWSYYPEQKVLDLAHGFRENRIPCDVIYLDIDYMDGYRCFTWSPKNFPTPRNMLDTLHDLGFKVVTIIDPGIKDQKGYRVFDSGMKKDVFVKYPDGKLFIGTVWPGECAFPDFFNKKAREWWGSQYKYLLGYGVDGAWNDMNEPSVFNGPDKTFPLDVVQHLDDGQTVTHAEVHNAYGMQMARGTRDGLERLEPDKRPFVLTRSNYAGGQRYAAMWTGDNVSTYAHMKLALTMFLNIGVSGQPFCGSDVGGFIGNPSPDLFSRWLELGVFTPFFRTHSVKGARPREPWVFGPEYTKINREIIDRRYELLPYIYTCFRNAHLSGLPILRPLYLDFPDDREAYRISDEFTFGRDLLVAPVLDSGAVSRKVYLPPDKWDDMYDGTENPGGWHEVNAPIGKTPVFVKNGTVLFTQSLIQSTSEQADTLILKVYGKTSAKGECYFDDGETYAFKHGDFLHVNVSYEKKGSRGFLKFEREGDYKPAYRHLAVEVMNGGGLDAENAILKTAHGKEVKGIVARLGNMLRLTFPFDADVEKIEF